jgi:hypothetical protein
MKITLNEESKPTRTGMMKTETITKDGIEKIKREKKRIYQKNYHQNYRKNDKSKQRADAKSRRQQRKRKEALEYYPKKREIYKQHLKGIHIDQLAKENFITPMEVQAIINKVEQVLKDQHKTHPLKITQMEHELFRLIEIEQKSGIRDKTLASKMKQYALAEAKY